jgi:phosphopentomutase
MRRAIFVVLDGVGVGALPDAAEYGDDGADTLGNVSRYVPLCLPFLGWMGLGNIEPLVGVPPVQSPASIVGRLAPVSVGKDTTVGHWEHMGLLTPHPFPTYPDGFPEEIIARFGQAIGRGILGNRAVSGTVIIAELGAEHMATGKPIVYTSADSVFQVATHVDVVPVDLLYSWCETARQILRGEHGVARVIARPFAGAPGAFTRTDDRRDFSLLPTGPTYLDYLTDAGVPVLALGKIGEIFAGRGISASLKVGSNAENLRTVRDLVTGRSAAGRFDEGLLITNLVDFDMVWGHRNDVVGFARGLEKADMGLKEVAQALKAEDLLLITADHGVDPTTPSTDHSREYVPVCVYPRPPMSVDRVYEGQFADSGATVYEHLTGKGAGLEGNAITRLRPKRGWRRYTWVHSQGAGALAGSPATVGPEEAKAAARWLCESVGPAPGMAVVLGSGLSFGYDEPAETEVSYRAIPHWRVVSVPGHPQTLVLIGFEGIRAAVLCGRVHEYEGFDLSEVQLPIRTLAAWGVRRVVLTSASGAVVDDLEPAAIVVTPTVVDLQHRTSDGEPETLPATRTSVMRTLRDIGDGSHGLREGKHASVPGPQYETPAELEVLRKAGVVTVSMSPASELRAALELSLEVVVLVVVTNAGASTHAEILARAGGSKESLTRSLATLARHWA